MRKVLSWAGLLTGALMVAAPTVRGEEPPLPKRTTPPVISSRQIDRYDAINVLRQRVKENPKSLADWIVLGELAHEVALDLPADQATRYYRMSRAAYEKALELQPNQPGLKAAIQFAKDHEANSQRFEEARDRATQAYLDARRRDLAATEYTPSLPLYGTCRAPLATGTAPAATAAPASATGVADTVAPVVPNRAAATAAPLVIPGALGPPHPTSTTATDPADRGAPPPAAPVLPRSFAEVPDRAAAAAVARSDPDAAVFPPTSAQKDYANYGTRQFYSPQVSTYLPYYAQDAPYTYQQYSSAYDAARLRNAPGTLPITAQRYYQNYQTLPYPERQPAGVGTP